MPIRDYSNYSKESLDSLFASEEFYFMKHCEVIRLKYNQKSIEEIASETSYVVGTVRTFIRLYYDILLPYALQLAIDIYSELTTPTADILEGHCAHLIYLNDMYGKNMYTKVGYSGQVENRFAQLQKAYSELCWAVPKAIYVFSTRGAAESMENYMREYFKTKYLNNFIKNDRFVDIRISHTDVELFDKKAQEIANLFQF